MTDVFRLKIDFPLTQSDNLCKQPRALWLKEPLVFVETAAQSSSDQRRRDCFCRADRVMSAELSVLTC